jgi:DNA-binding NarL/FixJ family response regulator
MEAVCPTVLIVDDHEGFREAVRSLLEAEGFDVVGEAIDGAEALVAAARLRPEIVLLDIQLPGLDGFAVAELLAATASAPKVVLISSREAAAYGPRVALAPVRGFLAKRELSGVALARLLA